MTVPEEATVFYTLNGGKFHEKPHCADRATSTHQRHTCSLREAVVEQDREPCGNCVGDALWTAYQEVADTD